MCSRDRSNPLHSSPRLYHIREKGVKACGSAKSWHRPRPTSTCFEVHIRAWGELVIRSGCDPDLGRGDILNLQSAEPAVEVRCYPVYAGLHGGLKRVCLGEILAKPGEGGFAPLPTCYVNENRCHQRGKMRPTACRECRDSLRPQYGPF